MIYAGKAHPNDYGGKQVIKEVFRFMEEYPEIHCSFIEDYDSYIAQLMVQGVDLWLNTPEPGREASGTSGMKAAVNGTTQIGTRDGWWVEQDPPEGYIYPKGLVEGDTGWGIGSKPEKEDILFLLDPEKAKDAREKQRAAHAAELMDKLDGDVIPRFEPNKPYHKKLEWARMGLAAIAYNGSYYNSHRMAQQSLEKYGIESKLTV
jgi:starch phosphorylase